MKTTLTVDELTSSVLAVPPLCRHDDTSLDMKENERLIRHLEAGGIGALLYGGNANFYHIRVSEYVDLLDMLSDVPADETLVIPSVGPAYGTMMDQAAILGNYHFPTVMVLPQQGMCTPEGIVHGVRRFVDDFGAPVILYIKFDGLIPVDRVNELFRDGLLAGIKYAIVRDDGSKDEYLRQLVDLVDPKIVFSGIGEQPAIVHMRDFGLAGFTSGCVCVAPRLAAEMLAAIRSGEYDHAEKLRSRFQPLEDLRNAIHPVRVLHEAVALAGIAETGPHLPWLSPLSADQRARIEPVAKELLALNNHQPVSELSRE